MVRSVLPVVAVLLTMVLLAPIGVAAEERTSCAPAAAYCVTAISDTGLDCQLTETEVSCTFSYTGAAVATGTDPLPGHLAARSGDLEFTLCSQPVPCTQDLWDSPTRSCSWAADEGGCSLDAWSESRTVTQDRDGCVIASAYHRVDGSTGPGILLTEEVSTRAYAEFASDDC